MRPHTAHARIRIRCIPGDADHRIKDLGNEFGTTSNRDLTESELQTLAEELTSVEDDIDRGELLEAAQRLNSFWDEWTEAMVEAQIEADSRNKSVCDRYGPRLDQAMAYGLIGEELRDTLVALNDQRHKPGHETWGDIDVRDPAFLTALTEALTLTRAHYEHLEQEHI